MILLGHLGHDAIHNQDPEGKDVINFNMATSDYCRGDMTTIWVNVSLWSKIKLLPYLKKGTKVLVDGHWNTHEYTDREGNKRWGINVRATSINLVGNKDHSADGTD